MRLRVVLLTLGDPERLTGGYLYQRRVAEAMPRHGARLLFVTAPLRPLPGAMIAGFPLLRRALRLDPDALLVDSIVTGALVPALHVLRPAVPVVGLLHQPPGGVGGAAGRYAPFQARLDRAFVSLAQRVMVPSETLLQRYVDAGASRDRFRVVTPGYDLPAPTGCAIDLPGDRPALLCVANWLPEKGIDTLLAAMALLPPGSGTLHLVGDPSADRRYAERLQTWLTHPLLRDRVVVHGTLPSEAVAAYYRAADLFVLPSRIEAYGMVFAEAQAAGLPVVAARAGHVPRIVEEGVTGLLVTPDDVGGLAKALGRLVADPALRATMGSAARERAVRFPRWSETAAGVVAVVRDLIEIGSR